MDELNKRAKLIAIFVLIIAGEAIFFLPFVIPRLFRPTVLAFFDITNFELGSFFSLYGFVAVGAYLLGGPLADRFSASRLMSVALVATGIGGVLLLLYPTKQTLFYLYPYWGLTTILLFWASLLKTTRLVGGTSQQGFMFGLLDGGRGLFAAVVGTAGVWLFSIFVKGDIDALTSADRNQAFLRMMTIITSFVFIAAILVFFVLRNFGQSDSSIRQKITVSDIIKVAKIPSVWLQSIIIICAYCGYKATDDFSLLAQDVLGYNEVEAAGLSTLTFWIRPIAAVSIGLLADRFSSSMMLIYCFSIMIISSIGIAFFSVDSSIVWLIILLVMTTSIAIYAMRGLYFAIMEEAKIPLSVTGTAVGLVSVIGYMPDIFMGPTMGYLLDRTPGYGGHQDLFYLLAGIAVVGLIASVIFYRVNISPESKF